MIQNLYWGKRLFFDTYQICSGYYPIGKLLHKSFSQTAVGELNGKSFTFRTSGVFKFQTEIIDNSTNTKIGDIRFLNGMTKANLFIHDRKLSWKNKNIRSTKWQISDEGSILVKYNGTSTGGQIESNTDNDLLVLSGLYIKNYYWKMIILVMFLALVSIWASVYSK